MKSEIIKSGTKNFEKKSSKLNENNVELESKIKGETGSKKLILVGSPNVGKNMLFNQLTGDNVTVSNYPGTTVTIDTGKHNIDGEEYDVINSPTMNSLSSSTEEERVSKMILLEERPDVLVHVVDVENLERMIPLTLQLIEANLPVVLALNMMDEVEKAGIKINHAGLEKKLAIPVVPTTANTGQGVNELIEKIGNYKKTSGFKVKYNEEFESVIHEITTFMDGEYPVSKRSLSLLLLQQDKDVENLVEEKEGTNYKKIKANINKTISNYSQPLNNLVKLKLQRNATEIVTPTLTDIIQNWFRKRR